eukprot:403375850
MFRTNHSQNNSNFVSITTSGQGTQTPKLKQKNSMDDNAGLIHLPQALQQAALNIQNQIQQQQLIKPPTPLMNNQQQTTQINQSHMQAINVPRSLKKRYSSTKADSYQNNNNATAPNQIESYGGVSSQNLNSAQTLKEGSALRQQIRPTPKFSQTKADMILQQQLNEQEEEKIAQNEIQLTKILLDQPAPMVSAQAWAVYDVKQNKLLFGKLERDRREIASLTKIMTCYTVIQLLNKFKIKEESTFVEISENAANIIGTSAELQEGDVLSVLDLLYGLMLPSGNDASIALAEYFGALLLQEKTEYSTWSIKLAELILCYRSCQTLLNKHEKQAFQVNCWNKVLQSPLQIRLSRSKFFCAVSLWKLDGQKQISWQIGQYQE